jgi:hypothetical protein
MMFAVTRGGDSGEDGSDSLSGGEFPPDDLCLAFDPAKARLGQERDTGNQRRGVQSLPGGGSR